MIIILRPPHTTRIGQPEDTHNFAKLKVLWRKEKFGLLSHRAVSGNWGVTAHIPPADAMSCLKKPWEAAFDRQVNAAGWRATGLLPFTQSIEKRLLAEVKDRAVAGDLLVHPSVQDHQESLVSAMFSAQPVGDSLAQAEGSSICLHSGMFWNRGPVTETVVYNKIKEIVVARKRKEQGNQDRKRKGEGVSSARREQALQENGRVLSLLQQGTRLSQLSCKLLSALLIARGLQCAKTKPGLLEQVEGLQLEGSADSVPLPQSISAVSDSHSDSGSESSVVSAGQQSDVEQSESEQSEELFFPAKIVYSCTRGKRFCYRVLRAGYGPAHETWEPHSSPGESGNRPLIMQYQKECKQWPPLKKWSDVQQPVTVCMQF